MAIYEQKFQVMMIELGLNGDILAAICGLAPSRLSKAFRGIQNFTGPEIEMLSSLFEHMRGIAREAAPLQVSFRDAKLTKDLIRKRERGLRIVPIFVGPPDVVQEAEEETALSMARQ